jgi:hypothetical protein
MPINVYPYTYMNRIQTFLLSGAFLVVQASTAQIEVDRPIEFTGPESSSKISGIQAVSEDHDGASKEYVDAAILAASGFQFSRTIGEFYGGGIIFYLWTDGVNEHGLVAATEDQSEAQVWSDANADLGPDDPANGPANTAAALAQPGHSTSAALQCVSYAGGGHSDWYLPAVWELSQLYMEISTINALLESDGNPATLPLEPGIYWSSTDFDDNSDAWYLDFSNGYTDAMGMISENRVRAIRRF